MKSKILLYLFFAFALSFSAFAQNEPFQLRQIACDLEQPWEITYGPDDHLWVTESRDYKLLRIEPNSGAISVVLDATNLKNFPNNQDPWPQGGFTGVALHPDLLTGKPYVYVAYVYEYNGCQPNSGGCFFKSKIERYDYNPATGTVSNAQTMLDNIPGSSDHNGGRLTIGYTGGVPHVFYSVGDMGAGQFSNKNRQNNAQDPNSLEGKILRLTLEPNGGSYIPSNNNFGNAVYTLGHRNPQGMVYANGTLYSTEHGPFTDDELNIIQTGQNYGHPLVSGFADGNYNGARVGTGQGLPLITNEQSNAANIQNYTDPINSYYDAPNADVVDFYNYAVNGNAPFPNFWLFRPSIAPAGIDHYGSSTIAGWQNSILIATLKKSTIYRQKLAPGGQSADGDLIPYFEGLGRFRDIALSPDGSKIYVATDKYGATSGPSQGTSIPPNNPGCILEFEYSPNITGCQNDYDGFTFIGDYNGSKYFISNESGNWANGSALAEFYNGYLASPNDQAENDFIQSYLAANNEIAFIGVTDGNTEGTFELASGEPLTFNNFTGTNTTNNNYAVMNFWDGSWGVNNLTTERRYVIEIPCSVSCTDNDNDGVCADADCDDNNGNIPAAPGSFCDDNNLNTTNDIIQSDGCTCAGSPPAITLELFCGDDIAFTLPSGSSSMQLNFGDPVANSNCPLGAAIISQISGVSPTDFVGPGTYNIAYSIEDGCGNSSGCSTNITVVGEQTTCDISFSTSNGAVIINGLTNAENTVLYDANISSVWNCNPWNGNPCTNNESITGLSAGQYFLSVQSDVCSEWIPITVSGNTACQASSSINGNVITITGLTVNSNETVQLQRVSDRFPIWECGPAFGGCSSTEIINGIPDGDYILDIQSDVCNLQIPYTIAENVLCDINGTITNIVCNTSGTLTYDIFVTGTNTDDNFFYLNVLTEMQSTSTLTLEYGQTHSITEAVFSLTTRTVTPFDDFNSSCDDIILIDCPAAGCNVNATASNGTITVTGLTSGENAKLFDETGNSSGIVWDCNPWDGNSCSGNEVISGLAAGNYFLSVQSDNCSEWIPITVEGGGNGNGNCAIEATVTNCQITLSAPINGVVPSNNFDLFVTGNNTSDNFIITTFNPVTGPTVLRLSYGETHRIITSSGGNGGSPVTVIVTDEFDSACSASVTVPCQEPVVAGCNVAATSANGEITITGLTSAENTKLFDADFNTAFECNPWNGNVCSDNEVVTGLNTGETYFLSVQSDECDEWIPVTVVGGGNGNEDCAIEATITNCQIALSASINGDVPSYDFDLFVTGNNTSDNFVITTFNPVTGPTDLELSYGETHRIFTSPSDGAYPVTVTVRDAEDESCTETVTLPCQEPDNCTINGTVTNCTYEEVGSGNGLLGAATYDLFVSGPQGSSFAIPISSGNGTVFQQLRYNQTHSIAEIRFPVTFKYIEDVANPDCNIMIPVECALLNAGCNVAATSADGVIAITGLTSVENTKLFDADFNAVFECNPWNGTPCSGIQTVSGLNTGETYFLSVQSDDCDEWIPVSVEGDGNGCIDSDNDGICDDVDCQPNNPSLPTNAGDACNDFDANTENDIIQSDGCTCVGTLVSSGCNVNLTQSNGTLTITGLTGLENAKIFDASAAASGIVWECNPWSTPCSNSEIVNGLIPNAQYFLSVQSDNCSEWIPFNVNTVPAAFVREEVIMNQFSITNLFPNPASTEAFVKLESNFSTEVIVEIYNVVGQVQKHFTSNMEEGTNTIQLDIQNLNVGIYHLVVKNQEGISETTRFIKQ